MATEKEAQKAREQHTDYLTKLGVHSIGVNVIGDPKEKNFGVVAFVEKDNKKLPQELIIQNGKKKVSVPLQAKTTTKFKPE